MIVGNVRKKKGVSTRSGLWAPRTVLFILIAAAIVLGESKLGSWCAQSLLQRELGEFLQEKKHVGKKCCP